MAYRTVYLPAEPHVFFLMGEQDCTIALISEQQSHEFLGESLVRQQFLAERDVDVQADDR